MKKLLLASLIVAGLIAAATHTSFRLAAQAGTPPSDARDCAVLVLGYPANADGTLHPVVEFRVRAGVRVHREHRCSQLVLSGGAVRNEHVEAEAMAALAASLGVPEEDLVLERRARSTWENVGCTAELVSSGPVFVVSDSLHARRAARYACRQDPARCERFLPRGTSPPIGSLWSIAAAANELRAFVRDLLVYESGARKSGPACSRGAAAG
ncbi:MAG: YdcF family protein [Myxococcota bacterium]|nr:YdcF family protein [Myxococcota bacterium]